LANILASRAWVNFYRWFGAFVLAGFTLFATLAANSFWEMVPPERMGAENAFFEHLGLVGGFLLLACDELGRQERERPRR
jgi:uncharacterized membrane protein YphA (DoxX/SURF4 family)